MQSHAKTALIASASTIALLLVVAAVAGFSRGPAEDRTRFTEIDVERINIIEPDGTIKLVISSSDRQVEATVGGTTVPIERERPAGLIFFNDDGDEVGGLVFGGDQSEGSVGLMMDQFKQDQVLALTHQEFTAPDGQRYRLSGLMAWDRPMDKTILDTVRLVEEAEAIADPEERAAAFERLHEEGILGTQRMFLGRSLEGKIGMFLHDGDGRPRLGLFVSPEGEAAIHFLNEEGEVVRTIGSEEE